MSASAIVLVMHGMTPKDFPPSEKSEYMKLRSVLHSHGPDNSACPEEKRQRFDELERKMRSWPRTESNDPFFAASAKIASALTKMCGITVITGFNEFCAPTVSDALDQAAGLGVSKIVVTTPMLTPGGHHSEHEIPEILDQWKTSHPNISVVYSWPFTIESIAEFLHSQITHQI